MAKPEMRMKILAYQMIYCNSQPELNIEAIDFSMNIVVGWHYDVLRIIPHTHYLFSIGSNTISYQFHLFFRFMTAQIATRTNHTWFLIATLGGDIQLSLSSEYTFRQFGTQVKAIRSDSLKDIPNFLNFLYIFRMLEVNHNAANIMFFTGFTLNYTGCLMKLKTTILID